MKPKTTSERGDTIIEVLFAMAIIGVVLAAAYAVASKNLRVSQLAKERVQATAVAIGQLDQLKSLDTPEEDADVASGNPFCIDITQADYIISGSPLPAACTVSSRFERSISRNSSTGTYVVKVEWIPPGGEDTNKAVVQFSYRE